MGSKSIIKSMNSSHVPKNPVAEEKIIKDATFTEHQDVDNMMFHSINGSGTKSLPIKCDKNFTVYKDKFYVTSSKGKAWVQVPDDNSVGYARISEYIENFSESNICAFHNKISVAYGGRGSENISIMTSDAEGKLWGVTSISKTATHDLQKGYDRIYIDFSDDGKTGYLAAVRNDGKADEEVFAFRSVNSGVTWYKVDDRDPFYNKIMTQFGL